MVEGRVDDRPGDASTPPPPPEPAPFETLSLWQALGTFLRAPGPTLKRILDVVRQVPDREDGDQGKTSPPAGAGTARRDRKAGAAASERDPRVRMLVLLHGAQSLFIIWLLIVLLLMAEPPATFQVQQLILMIWLLVNTAVVYGVWAGGAWARRTLPASEGFLMLLALLATLQWAQYAGGGAPPYAAWAGVFSLVNLALGALLAFQAGRGAASLERDGPPPWIADFGAYGVFLGMWCALLLAVAADSILAGATVSARRTPEVLYWGSPVLCAGMILWALVAVVVWQRRRLAHLVGQRRPGEAARPIEALAADAPPGPVMALPGAPVERVAGSLEEPIQVEVDSAEVAQFIAAMKAPELAEGDALEEPVGEVVDSEATVLPPAAEIAPAGARALAEGPEASVVRAPRRRLETSRRDAVSFAAVALALVMSTVVLLFVEPIRAQGILGWLVLVALWVGGSLACLLLFKVAWPRVMLGQAALLLSFAAFEGAAANRFTLGGVLAWLFSVIFWWLALRDPETKGPDIARWLAWARAWFLNPTIQFEVNWTLVVLVALTLVAAFFRFHDLDAVPQEMTSDAVEKLLDSARVFGDLGPDYLPNPQVFFPNNGGREPLQMYLAALTHRLTGIPYNFTLLKLVSALEAVVTIPLMYWMGRELAGRRAGLLAAALVAVSYWHTILGRMGLRIILTPLFMTAVIVYLVRAMRLNRRADFLRLGLALGAGVYAYQAMRMAPVFVVIAVGLAFLFLARRAGDRGRYIMNTVALVVIAVAVFAPMLRFMLDYPELFWMRTAGRLAGEPDEAGGWVEDPTELFMKNVSQFAENYNAAIWMYNWKGDVQWISNVPNQPELDPLSASLLALGLAGWLVRLARRRDPVDAAMLVVVAVMLLPSALALAFPNENPSATRASGTLPLIYLFAAVALDALLAQMQTAFARWVYALAGASVTLALLFGAANTNYDLFFNVYRESYYRSAKPHSTVGQVVRGFADSTGSMDSVLIVGYPHWLDHRAVGIEAGDISWGWVNRNTLANVTEIHAHLPEDRTTALMVVYHPADVEAFKYLRSILPEGRSMRYHVPGDSTKDFFLYIVPAPSEDPTMVREPPIEDTSGLPPPFEVEPTATPAVPPVQ